MFIDNCYEERAALENYYGIANTCAWELFRRKIHYSQLEAHISRLI